jgi:hypothetical protein
MTASGLSHWFSENAWRILAVHFVGEVALVAFVSLYLDTDLSTVVPLSVYRWSFYAFLGFLPVVAVALHYDREVYAERSDWTPSTFYYLVTLPFVFNVPIAALYFYRRHKHLGVP